MSVVVGHSPAWSHHILTHHHHNLSNLGLLSPPASPCHELEDIDIDWDLDIGMAQQQPQQPRRSRRNLARLASIQTMETDVDDSDNQDFGSSRYRYSGGSVTVEGQSDSSSLLLDISDTNQDVSGDGEPSSPTIYLPNSKDNPNSNLYNSMFVCLCDS